MKPALSIILFTTIAGAAQGMVVALALATLAGMAPATALAPLLWAATGMLLVLAMTTVRSIRARPVRGSSSVGNSSSRPAISLPRSPQPR
mgnify:CR=1 FL=1